MANDEHYTPLKFVKSAHAVLKGIDLDPCSNDTANKVVGAKVIMTVDDDSLSVKDWQGFASDVLLDARPPSVYMNPPYSKASGGAGKFIDKLIDQWDKGYVREAIVLLNNCTDTKWWQPLWQFSHCFVSPRIRFLDENLNEQGSPRYANVFVHLHDKHDPIGSSQRFLEEFSQHGHVTNMPKQKVKQ